MKQYIHYVEIEKIFITHDLTTMNIISDNRYVQNGLLEFFFNSSNGNFFYNDTNIIIITTNILFDGVFFFKKSIVSDSGRYIVFSNKRIKEIISGTISKNCSFYDISELKEYQSLANINSAPVHMKKYNFPVKDKNLIEYKVALYYVSGLSFVDIAQIINKDIKAISYYVKKMLVRYKLTNKIDLYLKLMLLL